VSAAACPSVDSVSRFLRFFKVGDIIAGPGAFTFFLGQRQPGLGRVVLYEFDFEGNRGGSYEPSLSLPINS
jgi:hypothetical protein